MRAERKIIRSAPAGRGIVAIAVAIVGLREVGGRNPDAWATIAAVFAIIAAVISALVRLPVEDSKANYLAGFWRRVDLLAADDYRGALEALYWPKGTSFTPHKLKERVTTFFGGDEPWSVVVPNDRLIGVINDAAEFQPQNRVGWAWFMAQVPLTTEPADPKNDGIPLMGLATSFVVREVGGKYVLELEIFHV
jgi:hypothetical protein